ncbi:hypothetical protein Vadar_017437 [Vaccinium darrowii]|uniref:Uncharacterized protein n=1 Tax=Vaccinium darrowii TaxID=229202 RepID=A0ACB7Y000_9ERIC|nr:hypothetical protein Vadar_017437 [Vaccinium darrowii]
MYDVINPPRLKRVADLRFLTLAGGGVCVGMAKAGGGAVEGRGEEKRGVVEVYLTLCCTLIASAVGVCLHIFWDIGGFLTAFGSAGSIIWITSILKKPHEEQKGVAALMASGFCYGATFGLGIDLAVPIHPSILVSASVGCAVAFGCFSAAATLTRRREYLYLGGLLSSSLSLLFWLHFASSVIGGSYALFTFDLYFGLMVFMGYNVIHTQGMIGRAHSGDLNYINDALGLFTATYLNHQRNWSGGGEEERLRTKVVVWNLPKRRNPPLPLPQSLSSKPLAPRPADTCSTEMEKRDGGKLMVYLLQCCALIASAVGAYLHILWDIGMTYPTSIAAMGCMLQIIALPPYEKQKRVALWMATGFLYGATFCLFVDKGTEIDPSILVIAFLGCALAFGCFLGAATLARRREYLYLGGLLSSLLSLIFWLHYASSFLGGSAAVFKLNLYFGFLMLVGYIVLDTQGLIEKVHRGDLDYVKHAMALSTDGIGVFIEVPYIMLKNFQKDKENKKK